MMLGKRRRRFKSTATGKARDCSFCENKNVPYTCSQCELPYCSSECFSSPNHLQCSENFFRKSVFEHLKSIKSSDEEKKNFLQKLKGMSTKINSHDYTDILKRLDEPDFDLLEDEDDDDWEKVDVEQANMPQKMKDFLQKIPQIEDVDNLWHVLNLEEQEEFIDLIEQNSTLVDKLMDVWKPWWYENDWQQVVAMFDESDASKSHPKLYTDFQTETKKLDSSTGTAILCTLLSYCYICRLYNGEISCCAHIEERSHSSGQWHASILEEILQLSDYLDPSKGSLEDLTTLDALNVIITRILTFESTGSSLDNISVQKKQICQLLDDVYTLIDYVGQPKRTLVVVSGSEKYFSPKAVLYALSDLIHIVKRIGKCSIEANTDQASLIAAVCGKLVTYLNYCIQHSADFAKCQPLFAQAIDFYREKFRQETSLFEIETESSQNRPPEKKKLIEELS